MPVRVTRNHEVTIPLEVRRALGIRPGSEVQFRIEEDGVRLVIDPQALADEIADLRGAGSGELSTEEILALTRG
jgi:AbrB family looped-hinge helix DNA binding protein